MSGSGHGTVGDAGDGTTRPTGPALFSLAGRTALVTGSSRGIGNALAVGLAAAGARVVVHGRAPASAEAGLPAVAAAAQQAGAPAPVAEGFDVTDEQAVLDGVARIESQHPVDVLVCNVGVQHREPLLEVASSDFERVLRTNLTAAFLVCRAVARGMVGRGTGKIVTVCSVQTDLARPGIAAYAASKGGLRNLTRSMCAEWAPHGLGVNGLAPGYIVTDLTRPLVADEAFDTWVRGRTPAGRWGQVEDLVGTCVWLSSAASDFVNGQVVFVDGGMTAVV